LFSYGGREREIGGWRERLFRFCFLLPQRYGRGEREEVEGKRRKGGGRVCFFVFRKGGRKKKESFFCLVLGAER
jgi:hypothetical protein